MHPKQRYKICICSAILVQLESFGNYRGLQYYCPEHFSCNLTDDESENFSILPTPPPSSKNLRFPFFYENNLT